ncbi:MAG: dihydrolipoyl dehydrogenase, partial [Candidatus Bathyarchaeia archaeon]
MEEFDVLVIGSGSGMLVASAAVESGFKVALVENGKMGGTCINVGCVPSKMLIYPADVTQTLAEAEKIGVKATLNSVDFQKIMNRMHSLVSHDTEQQAAAVEASPEMKWFKESGEFISDYTMKIGGQTIKAKAIFIASGARPLVPPIKGIEKVSYLTSDTVLQLQTQPRSIIIVGGGYIGMEYGHFFAGIGTKTIIVQREERLLQEEEPEISDLLKSEAEKRMDIFLNFEAVEVREEGNQKILVAKNRKDGTEKTFTADAIMIAVGRTPNAASFHPEKTGVQLDPRGFVVVNEYLETAKKHIYAFGDAIGKQMFKHAANYEAGLVWHNFLNEKNKVKMNFWATPHGVFTHPQIASVGLKEEEARKHYNILVGRAEYKETAMGAAMGEPEGFVKVIVEKETNKILGAHIIGPEAAVLIQEITNAMVTGNG